LGANETEGEREGEGEAKEEPIFVFVDEEEEGYRKEGSDKVVEENGGSLPVLVCTWAWS
jgi:hypothetical protein